MKTNNHKIEDYDLVLDEKYGKEGTPQRVQFENEAKAFLCLANPFTSTQGSKNDANRIGRKSRYDQVIHIKNRKRID